MKRKQKKMLKVNNIVQCGKFLIAEPFLPDPYFKRAVVLISEHSEKGSVGFILNKPTDLPLNEAVQDFPYFDAPLFFGGPVQGDTLHYVHRLGDKLTGSREIVDGIYWGGDFEALKLLIDTKQVAPSEIRFFLGYSGWQSQQLDSEIKEKSWIVTPATPHFTFLAAPKKLWQDVLKSMGAEYAILSNFPEDPSLN